MGPRILEGGRVAELRQRARAFADAWAPMASSVAADVAAARAAGYEGDDAALRTQGARLRRDPRVRARIETRLLRPIEELLAEAKAAAAAAAPAVASPPARGLVKGRGRGTATERIELLMAMGRSKKGSIKERVAAIGMAAELEGELRRGRSGHGPAVAAVAPPPVVPARATGTSGGPPRLRLVVNDLDAERSE